MLGHSGRSTSHQLPHARQAWATLILCGWLASACLPSSPRPTGNCAPVDSAQAVELATHALHEFIVSRIPEHLRDSIGIEFPPYTVTTFERDRQGVTVKLAAPGYRGLAGRVLLAGCGIVKEVKLYP
jgi:hypothetical protein